MTSYIIDLIIRIKNGYRAKNDRIEVRYSKLNIKVLEILQRNHYLQDFEVQQGEGPKKHVFVNLLYNNGEPVLQDVKIVSKPGVRMYSKVKELKPVLNGLGLGIISTSKGVMTQSEAKKLKLGGEVLFKIW